MIAKWKVSNFKSIREKTDLNLAPLTIFAGANSSGKSTFIQSILLVAQTLAYKIGSRTVVLNGALASLGQFDDLKSNGSESDQITIKYTCRPIHNQDVTTQKAERFATRYRTSDILKEVTCEMSFGTDRSSPEEGFLQIQPRLFTTHLTSMFRDEEDKTQKTYISTRYSDKIKKTEAIEQVIDRLRADLHYEVTLDKDSMDEIKERYRSAKPVACALQHFLPQLIVCEIDRIREDANDITSVLQERTPRIIRRRPSASGVIPNEVIEVLQNVLKDTISIDGLLKEKSKQESLFKLEMGTLTLRDWIGFVNSLPRDDQKKIRRTFLEREDLVDLIYEAIKKSGVYDSGPNEVQVRLPYQITEAARYLDYFFSSRLKYLGPLRDSPKPLYPIAPVYDPDDVGLRGEHTASVLELHKKRKVTYIPSSAFGSAPIHNKPIVTETLETAVTDWLEYLSIASSVESQDLGKLGHELKVKHSKSDSTHDLTHVGVGVSQVLPILVMCLLADTDSTLVFEQPELHLHPKVQTLLGDFFLSMALCGKQCIVETHSEYFINRLRFRIAAASDENKLKDKTKIYFVEKTSMGSSFQEVVINEYGAISNWPEGFFDQSQKQAEEILLAASAKSKERSEK